MVSPENPGDSPDPTIRPIEELLASMNGEHVGSEHVGSEALSSAAGAETFRPVLPSTVNDVRWEAQHNGEVSVVDCRDDTHRGGAIKIYRSPVYEAGYTLKPPVGPEILISPGDIVQIYPRDSNGDLPQDPSYIFQGIDDVPGGYTLTRNGTRVPSRKEEMQEWMKNHQEMKATIAENLEDPERILGDRLEGDNRTLRFLSSLFLEGRGVFTPDYRLDGQTTLVWYPLPGKALNVVTPSGKLIKGHRTDIVEIVRVYPDGSRTTLRRATLAKLAEDDERYMVLPEVYKGR